ncbi:MAG: hypothetical protein GWN99_19195 [Gemmatimonadetes bacterium]|uniref:Lipoprotein n=1 Tax=Candidatus Kutchimonas denitrificans TaxID=3056748 RepID=A0AAE4Z7B7_9BACT|nr:hypothetical protein [Gemmatimonadota bacterium]NIR73792.1 hypothetical protein [Candidatus Kutchimonas denitrificans]NIS03156.1 hypothetical protein [Gemmatimonadota bacterium]NIT69057.1 hypothetical protein [Gemmatimonadota bacterium]NIU54148.1 hypothetical protein [Gemmatimonadota bacterium]
MNGGKYPCWRSALAIAVTVWLAGCAAHADTMGGVREALLHNDLDEARARLADAGRGTDDLLFALEDGLLLHYAGDPELSNARFEFAEQRVDELYTKSVARAAISLVTSDLVLKFEPRGIDNFLINYYRALNYMQLDDEPGALVEWRKLNSKLQFSRQQGDARYLDPPFFDYLAGLGLEADDPNEAYVSMRLAEAGYRVRGIAPPVELLDDLFRLAGDLGFEDHLEMYRGRYGVPADLEPLSYSEPGGGGAGGEFGARTGEVVVLLEDGLVAPIEEVRAYIPITEERASALEGSDREDRFDLALSLAEDYERGRYRDVTRRHAKRREIAYVMPLSLPAYGRGDPAFDWAEVIVGDASADARVLLEVSALQRAAFEDALLGIYAKTIARALVKWFAAAKLEEEAEEEGGDTAGDIVGALANVINVATERADTRAWLGLPDRIWMVRVRVAPGIHELRVRLPEFGEQSLGPVEVKAGSRTFVSFRVF